MRALFGLEDYYGDGALTATDGVELDLTYNDVGSSKFIPSGQTTSVFMVAPTSPYVEVPEGILETFAEFGVPVMPGESAGTNFVPADLPDGYDTTSSLFDFGFMVNPTGDADLDALGDTVIAIATAAFQNISQFINGAEGASIDVEINLLQQGPSTVASAGATSIFFGDVVNGVQELLTGAQIELQFGVDPNGADTSDIVININTDFLLGENAFFETGADRVVPAGALDYVSVLTHELFHGLGFFSFRDNTGAPAMADFDGDGTMEEFESTYGLNVSFDENLQPSYDGENVVDVYGEAINLESTFDSAGSDISHFAAFNRDGSIADTILALMNPSVIGGDITTIGALELAVLADLGYDISSPADLALVNDLDGLPFTPTITVNPDIAIADGAASISIELDSETLFTSVPTSVGVEITAADGTTQTLRARIDADDLMTNIALDDDMLRALAEDGATSVSVRLFYPAQAVLENGEVEQIVEIPLNALFGVGTDGDDTIKLSQQVVGFGGEGDDNVSTGEFDDILFGEGGDDIIQSGAGNDRVEGGLGDDLIYGANGDDILNGGEGDDIITSGRGDDVSNGGAGDDILFGNQGNDQLFGGDGNDQVSGNAGDDFLDGGAGNDFLSGGGGSDTFVFGDGYGSDTVVRFGDGEDFLLLTDFTEEELDNAIANRTGDENQTILDFGDGDVLTLNGISVDDFGFDNLLLALVEPEVEAV